MKLPIIALAIACITPVSAQERRIPRPSGGESAGRVADGAPLTSGSGPVGRTIVVGSATLIVQDCWEDSGIVACQFSLTSTAKASRRFAGTRLLSRLQVIDDQQRAHGFVSGYFLDGTGQPQPMLTLDPGERATLIQQFQSGAASIRNIRLVAPGGKGTSVEIPLRGSR